MTSWYQKESSLNDYLRVARQESDRWELASLSPLLLPSQFLLTLCRISVSFRLEAQSFQEVNPNVV